MDKHEVLYELQSAKDRLEAEKNYRNRIIDSEIVRIDALSAAVETIQDLIKSLSGNK